VRRFSNAPTQDDRSHRAKDVGRSKTRKRR